MITKFSKFDELPDSVLSDLKDLVYEEIYEKLKADTLELTEVEVIGCLFEAFKLFVIFKQKELGKLDSFDSIVNNYVILDLISSEVYQLFHNIKDSEYENDKI